MKFMKLGSKPDTFQMEGNDVRSDFLRLCLLSFGAYSLFCENISVFSCIHHGFFFFQSKNSENISLLDFHMKF